MITDPVLLAFCDETIRPLADRLAGLLDVPATVLDAAVGKGVPAALGTDAATLTRAEPWADADYAALSFVGEIEDSGKGRQTALTNLDVIGLLRVAAALRAMIDANPALRPLVRKVAVNPRA